MRNFTKSLLLLLVVGFTFMGCEKEEATPPDLTKEMVGKWDGIFILSSEDMLTTSAYVESVDNEKTISIEIGNLNPFEGICENDTLFNLEEQVWQWSDDKDPWVITGGIGWVSSDNTFNVGIKTEAGDIGFVGTND